MRVNGDGDVGIEVFIAGPKDGPPVLLMHGWPDTHALWQPQIDALAAAGYRTIAPDLRGFGESGKPEEVEAYALTHTVFDMVAVLDSLGIDKLPVIAHDWGAAAAWGMAGFLPDRVEKLAVLAVGHPSAFAAAGLEQRMKSWYMLLFQFDIAEAWLDKFGGLMLGSHKGGDEILAGWKADKNSVRAGLGWYRANANPRTLLRDRVDIPNVQCPTLGIFAAHDLALTEKQMVSSSDFVDGPWTYEKIEGAGHWMQLDAPDELNRLLLDFLA